MQEVAIGLIGLMYAMFWLHSQEHMRKKHEPLSLLFLFLGFYIGWVLLAAMPEWARSEGFFSIEKMAVALLEIYSWSLMLVLFYFVLMFTIWVFKSFFKEKTGLEGCGQEGD